MEATVGIIECGAATGIPPSNGCFTVAPAKFWPVAKWFLKKGFPTETEIAWFETENIFTLWGRCTSCCTGYDVREKWVPPCLSWLKDFYIIKTKNQCREGQQHISLDLYKTISCWKPRGCFNRLWKLFRCFCLELKSKFRDMPSTYITNIKLQG